MALFTPLRFVVVRRGAAGKGHSIAAWMRITGVVATVLAAIATAAVAVTAASARATDASMTFPGDIEAEHVGGPLVRSITVTPNADGTTSFHVDIANRPSLGPNDYVQIWIDSDNNPATGSSAISHCCPTCPTEIGADFEILDYTTYTGARLTALQQYDPGLLTFDPAPSSAATAYTSTGPTYTVAINSSRLFTIWGYAWTGVEVGKTWSPQTVFNQFGKFQVRFPIKPLVG